MKRASRPRLHQTATLAQQVSVPLRGISDETDTNVPAEELHAEVVRMFPSPCGELVMKRCALLTEGIRWAIDIEFPSPCGELVMKQRT